MSTVSTAPAVSRAVVSKLLFASAAMVVLPLGSYYASLHYVFQGYKTGYAAITAAVVANLVVVGYVIAAVLEDDTGAAVVVDPTAASKKTQ